MVTMFMQLAHGAAEPMHETNNLLPQETCSTTLTTRGNTLQCSCVHIVLNVMCVVVSPAYPLLSWWTGNLQRLSASCLLHYLRLHLFPKSHSFICLASCRPWACVCDTDRDYKRKSVVCSPSWITWPRDKAITCRSITLWGRSTWLFWMTAVTPRLGVKAQHERSTRTQWSFEKQMISILMRTMI